MAAIRLLILTGARLREILHARWEHVDIERGVIFLADSKTGRKPVFLARLLIDLVASVHLARPAIIPHEFVQWQWATGAASTFGAENRTHFHEPTGCEEGIGGRELQFILPGPDPRRDWGYARFAHQKINFVDLHLLAH